MTIMSKYTAILATLLLSYTHHTSAQTTLSTGELVLTYSHTTPATLKSYTQNNTVDPATGQTVTDALFNSGVTKIADVKNMPSETVQSGAYIRPVSSRFSHYNSDGSLYMLVKDGQYGSGQTGNTVIFNANHSLATQLPGTSGSGAIQAVYSKPTNEFRFDRNVEFPTTMYWVSECVFYSYDLEDGSTGEDPPALHDFGQQFTNCYSIGNGVHGDSSADSRYWAFIVQTLQNGAPAVQSIVTYDKTTDSVVGWLNATSSAPLPTPLYVDVSPRGSHVLVQWPATGAGNQFDGPHVYDIVFSQSSAVRVGDDSTSPNGWAYNGNSAQVVVSHVASNAWSAASAGTVVSTDVRTGLVSTLVYDADLTQFVSASCSWNFGRTYDMQYFGWISASTYCTYNANAIVAAQNQNMLIEIPASADASSRLYLIGYTHNNWNSTTNAGNTVFSSISQDMRNVLFAAQWTGASKNTWQNAYQTPLHSNWLTDLSARPMPPALGSSSYEPQPSVPHTSNSTLPTLLPPSIGGSSSSPNKTPVQSSAAVVSASVAVLLSTVALTVIS